MHRRNVNTDDLIAQVYGSEDFREGVRSFLEHRQAKFRRLLAWLGSDLLFRQRQVENSLGADDLGQMEPHQVSLS